MSRKGPRGVEELLDEREETLPFLEAFGLVSGLMLMGLAARPAWVCSCRSDGELMCPREGSVDGADRLWWTR
jgi:hypothetical protein